MKLRFGMLVTGAVGKSQGQCIQRYKNTYVLRKISIPVQRALSTQNPQRAVSSFLFNTWRFQRADIRAVWATVALRLYRITPFGDIVTLSAREAFTRLNMVIYPYLGDIINPNDFVGVIPVIAIEPIVITRITGTISIFDSIATNVEFYQLKAKRLPSIAINPTIGKLRTFARTTNLGAVNINFVALQSVVGVLTVGDVVSIAVRGVALDGMVSPWVQQQVVVT